MLDMLLDDVVVELGRGDVDPAVGDDLLADPAANLLAQLERAIQSQPPAAATSPPEPAANAAPTA